MQRPYGPSSPLRGSTTDRQQRDDALRQPCFTKRDDTAEQEQPEQDEDARSPVTARPWWRARSGARGSSSRVAQGPGDGLELRLDDVVRVAAVRHADVQADRGLGDERLEDVPGQRGVVVGPIIGAMPSGSACTRYGRPDRSTTACASVSSSGTIASPKRRMPACRPAPARNAWPSAIAVSSTVWWRVDVQVAARSSRCRSNSAVLAELVEHVVVEPDAGGDVGLPVPSRSISTRRFVSLVARSTRPCAVLRTPPVRASPSGLLRPAARRRNASFSSGVPTVTRS